MSTMTTTEVGTVRLLLRRLLIKRLLIKIQKIKSAKIIKIKNGKDSRFMSTITTTDGEVMQIFIIIHYIQHKVQT